jgi:hypothetical protein
MLRKKIKRTPMVWMGKEVIKKKQHMILKPTKPVNNKPNLSLLKTSHF